LQPSTRSNRNSHTSWSTIHITRTQHTRRPRPPWAPRHHADHQSSATIPAAALVVVRKTTPPPPTMNLTPSTPRLQYSRNQPCRHNPPLRRTRA
jgi:hypothetical protein